MKPTNLLPMAGTGISGADWEFTYPPGETLLLRIPTCPPLEPGPHPHVLKRYEETLEFKLSSPKRWVQRSGRVFLTLLPRSVIQLVPECGYSYPRFWVGDHDYAFNCCGGTGRTKSWGDMLPAGGVASITCPRNLTELRNLLDHAVPITPEWVGRLPLSVAEQDAAVAAWYAERRDQLITVAAWGDWHTSVPQGWVGVCAVKGGGRDPRQPNPSNAYFLVPKVEYDTRHLNPTGSITVDPDRHPAWTHPDL